MLLSRPLFGCLLCLALLSMFLMVNCAGESGGGNDDLATNESGAGYDLVTEPPNSALGNDPDADFSPTPMRGNATEPVTTVDVEGRVFIFDDGAAFDLPGKEVTLAIDANGLLLDTVLVVGTESLSGRFFVDEANRDDGRNGECWLVFDTVSRSGLILGPVIRFDQCAIDSRDRLIVRNEDTGRQSVSDLDRSNEAPPPVRTP